MTDHWCGWGRITTDRYHRALVKKPAKTSHIELTCKELAQEPRVIPALLALLHRKPVWEVDDAAKDKER